MTSEALAHRGPFVAARRDRHQRVQLLTLEPPQRAVIVVFVAAVVAAVAVPYPVTKIVLGGVLALYWAKLFSEFDERFIGMFVLFLPTLQLLPLQALGVPALNWQTIFLIIFVVAILGADSPRSTIAAPGWIAYFSVVLILSAFYAWLTLRMPLWPLLVVVKNWLFPFSLFFLGRRYVRNARQLWFLFLCVAIACAALSAHGLRDGLTTGHLLTNRPPGLMTGQPNLFAGFLAMHGLMCLFVARTRELGRMERLFLAGTTFAIVVTLLFTLSRGAWLAFAVAGAFVGLAANRGAVALLVLLVLVGVQWAPEEAVTRADLTLTAVEESGGNSALEDTLDDSAALRIIQWKSLPTLWLDSPLWGSGLESYARRLGHHTGIYRSAHATMVQIGTEQGTLGLLGYLGLFASVALVCAKRAWSAAPGTFPRTVGMGLLAATVCLFLADFSGTRFPTHTVTTYFWLLVGAFIGCTEPAPAPVPSRSR